MDGACPKCGSTAGWNGPTYRSTCVPIFQHGRPVAPRCYEQLIYACQTCGFEQSVPTKDSQTPPAADLDGVTVREPWWPFGGLFGRKDGR